MTTPTGPMALFRALRPKQWSKNLLVVAAPVAAGVIDQAGVLREVGAAFVSFCLAASATYLLNDVRDVEVDRRHPHKRHRPVAAGELGVAMALTTAVVLLAASLLLAFGTTPALGRTIAAYVVLTAAYSLGLKHVAVVDVLAVASGFVLRAVAGAAATGVPISEWFFIVTSAGALLMVAGKRTAEASDLGVDASGIRPTLGVYSSDYLGYLRSVASGVLLVGYCLWAFGSADLNPGAGLWYQLSILPFAAAVLRYALLVDQGAGAQPEELVLADRGLLTAGAIWATSYGWAVYVG